jgi:hypothetical protein
MAAEAAGALFCLRTWLLDCTEAWLAAWLAARTPLATTAWTSHGVLACVLL